MKFKYILSIFLFLSAFVFGQSTVNINKPKHVRVCEAYGFIIGQEYYLNQIKEEFPQLEIDILRTEMSFNSTFGKAKDGMSKYLNEYFGQDEFKKYENETISEIKEILSNQSFTEEIVKKSIDEIESRANGNIVSPILETLLSFQFADRPQDEFISGFTTTFNTKGHSKSKFTDWQIKVPKSWKAQESDRPNIIQKFTSDYGAGHQGIMLLVKDITFSNNHKMSKEEINEIFTEKEMRDAVPDNGKFISFTKMTFDGINGGMIESEKIMERLNFKIKIRMVQFMFIHANKMYAIEGFVSSDNIDADLSLDMRKYLPLYMLIANSIVVNDQYK
jgi:hypothetical protein